MPEPGKFVEELLAQMTPSEKIGQLHQSFARSERDFENIKKGNTGSVINASGALTGQGFSASGSAENANTLQRMARESRLKIPMLFGRDVIHGFRTVFPIPLAQAASFNLDLIQSAATVAAREASATGIKWTFAPMLDIARDPRWGRIAEGGGEDPVHGARIAAALVHGFQGSDMAQADKLVACAKHYVGYGSAEGGRDYDNGEISEPTLRDIYLPPFESAVRAGVGSIMPAFLDLNGVPVTADRRLLTDILRGEWGFDGFVVSDWNAVAELIHHGVAGDRAQAAALALQAGVDMDMISHVFLENLGAGVKNGTVSASVIDEAVRRILRIKHRAGLFDNPFTDPKRSSREILTVESRQLARRFARESMVLLKNRDGILPLCGCRKILVAGPFVHARSELYGTWTPDGRADDVAPLSEALAETAPAAVELMFADKPDLALANSYRTDAIVLVAGEHPLRSGENSNVSDLGLPPGQSEWIEAMTAFGKPLILVVFAGRPLAITRQAAQVDAVLYAWHPGIEGGAALGEILFGQATPSGRLPVTFPRVTGQIPIYYNHKNSGRPLRVGTDYRTRYVDSLTDPLYPFGYGLTYTTFDYANMKISRRTKGGMRIEISAEISNTGQRTGTELVQLYTRDLVGSLTRPVRELKDYRQIELQPGETRRVAFELTEEALAFTGANGIKTVEPGVFQAWIAPDSRSGLMDEFTI